MDRSPLPLSDLQASPRIRIMAWLPPEQQWSNDIMPPFSGCTKKHAISRYVSVPSILERQKSLPRALIADGRRALGVHHHKHLAHRSSHVVPNHVLHAQHVCCSSRRETPKATLKGRCGCPR